MKDKILKSAPFSSKEWRSVLVKHARWTRDEKQGEQANLTEANLSGAYLSLANLAGANLSKADLTGANLTGANLSKANLTGANLSKADLTGANLSKADLTGVNLTGADVAGVTGNDREVISLSTDTYVIAYTAQFIQIGCKRYAIKDWWGFDDGQILDMDGKKALTFWKKWRPLLRQIIKISPGVPTGNQG